MSLKSFLQEKGYIQSESGSGEVSKTVTQNGGSESPAPVYFPLTESQPYQDVPVTKFGIQNDIAQPESLSSPRIDDAFIKFFEDELLKANLPGPDYFEFRKQMITMHQKMTNKGASEEVILQAVLASFDAQGVAPSTLIEAAKTYRQIITAKKDEFLKGASSEKENQLKIRQNAFRTHQDNLNQMQNQLLILQRQIDKLNDDIAKEQAKGELDKNLGKTGIEKIEKAEKQIVFAYNHMLTSIDADIERLHSSS